MTTIPTIGRAEYKSRLDAGEKFTPASLYEPDHAPKSAKFVFVLIAKGDKKLMRIRPRCKTNSNPAT